MKYAYRIWCLEGTDTKKIEWHFPTKDDIKVPHEDLEELFKTFAEREDIKTLVIDCYHMGLLYTLKGMFSKMLGNALREKNGKYLNFNCQGTTRKDGTGYMTFRKRKPKDE